ncbi:unnamed protein product [Tuber aestivum]|uniref:Uncharacterized protein n=1 Tax=Tuber aestivum TaxID=59557 RepID=A0A292PRK4_9PEZI|nr:unnamed protein product [Tuber aestivum]
MLRSFQLIAHPFARPYTIGFNYCRNGDKEPLVSLEYHKSAIAEHESLSSKRLEAQDQIYMSSHKSTMDSIRSSHDKKMKDMQDSFEKALQADKDHYRKFLEPDRKVLQERENEYNDMNWRCEDLKVCSSLPLTCMLPLILLQKKTLEILSEKMWLERNFNIRGALERIVYQYKHPKDIWSSKGIQQVLNEIAKTKAFDAVLQKEVQTHRLVRERVMDCVHNIYHEVSKHAHGNDGMILVRAIDFTRNERAALVAFLRLQSTWKNPLSWQEIELSDEGKERV